MTAPAAPAKVFVLNATTDSDVLLPVVSTSQTPEGAMYVQVQWGNGTYEWLKPVEYRAAYYNRDMESWEQVPTPAEYAAAQTMAAERAAAWESFKAEFFA